MIKKIIIILLCLAFYLTNAQTGNPVDSLLKILTAAKEDSVRARIYSQLTEVCEVNEIPQYAEKTIKIADKYAASADLKLKNKFLGYKASAINNLAFTADAEGDVDKCIQLYKEALAIREAIKDTNAIGNTLFNLAALYKSTGKIDEALEMNKKALLFLSLKNNKGGMSKCYFAIGDIHLTRGNIAGALKYLDLSLKTSTEINDKSGIAAALTGLGTIQGTLGEFKKEQEYLNRCIKIQEEIGDRFGLAFSYNNLAFVLFNSKDYLKAKESFEKSLEYSESVSDWNSIALANHNLGNVYYELRDTVKALEFYKKSLSISDKIKDEMGRSRTLINLGKTYYFQGNHPDAKKYLEEAYAIGTKLGYTEAIRTSAETLSSLYAAENNFKQAYLMHTKFKRLSDTLFSRENKKASYKYQVKLEFEKKEAEAKVIARAEREKIEAVAKEEKKQARIIILGVSCVLMLMILLALFIYRSYRQKQKANVMLEEKNVLIEIQKELVEEKQKEVLDSIHYAKRIQSAILATEPDIQKYFPESFLLYEPKDIVAGDFYFFEATDSHVFYAAADCTGHGVPGALVSVVCSNALTRCVKEFALTDPGKILDKARELVVDTFKRSGQDVKDGMDISLLVKNIKQNTYAWAGANNPLWYISAGAGKQFEIKEITANKQPIGLSENPKDFISHELDLLKDDTVFLFTDGYADQFGGPKGKKFKYKQLAELLLANIQRPLNEQKTKLSFAFNDWKGPLEQVDDVCVIGIRV